MNESFNQNIKNLGVGIAATVASVGISEDAVAQQGLLGKIKDKIQDKIELVSHRDQESKQSENPEIKKDSIFYNDANDHAGFKYPFDKEYKSDEDYYRSVVYVQDYLLEGAIEDITEKAIDKVKNETGINASILDIKTLRQEEFKNKNTGLITVVIAFEIKKPHVSWEGDKTGIKYPFDKEYKSDENFYRTVAYANMKGEGMTSEQLLQHSEAEAEMNAHFNILRQEMGLEGEIKFYQENNQEPQIKFGDKKIHLGYVKIIDKANFRDTRTGVCTTVLAVEISKKGIKIEKTEPSVEIQKTKNEKFEENLSGEWQKHKVEKHEEPPIRNKPEKQPVYHPTPKVEKADYQVTFEDFKKAEESDFDSYSKKRESDLNALKKSQEEEFNKFKEGK